MIDKTDREDVWIAHYRLRSRGFLNALSGRREFAGVLIRVGEGYGCIHPWPELGDPSLERCLDDLKGRRFWPIVRRALRCAEFDGAMRETEESLFEEMEVPASHATLAEVDMAGLAAAVEAGFSVVKMKGGRDLAAEAKFLEEGVGEFPQLRWRLDFNEILDPGEAEVFLMGLSEKVRRSLDFVEDVCPFSETIWAGLRERTRVRLAVDREVGPHRVAADVAVIKPAVDEPFLLAEGAMGHGQSVVVTSYMDHPLGQAFAAWEAARAGLMFPGLVGVCGLQTHHLFERDGFSEVLGDWGPEFRVPEGTGLGFNDALEELTWMRLD